MTRSLSIASSQLTRILGGIVLLLVGAQLLRLILLHGFGHDSVLGLARLFDLNVERNVPTLFSSALFSIAALLCFVIGRAQERHRLRWVALAGILLFLAVDESVMIHEMLGAPVRNTLGITSGFLYFAWFLPYMAVVLILACFYLPWYLSFPRRTRALLALSAAIYIGGAVGIESLQGWYLEGMNSTVMGYLILDLLITIEEVGEMAGIVLFIHILCQHIGLGLGGITISISDPSTRSTGFSRTLIRPRPGFVKWLGRDSAPDQQPESRTPASHGIVR